VQFDLPLDQNTAVVTQGPVPINAQATFSLGQFGSINGTVSLALPQGTSLPWHRVLGAGGKISLPVGTASGDEQRARLRAEGVTIENNRVDMQCHGWRPIEHCG
jgi:methylated-DNA-protein-cysteine methyltransferase-like protein